MGRDLGDEGGGDQVAWLDLVARLEAPSAIDPAAAPWPDREDLGAVAGQADPADNPADNPAGAAPAQPTALPSDGIGLARRADRPGSGAHPGKHAPTNRSRVIRPASFMRFANPAPGSAEARAQDASRDYDDSADEQGYWGVPAEGRTADWRLAEGGAEPEADDGAEGSEPPAWRASRYDMSADDHLNLADISYIDYDIGDQDDRYVPPPVPPQPNLDPVARGAWAALLGGPGYLFVATLLSWQIPGWVELAAIIAFVAGFVVLVFRLGDGPSKRDGPDQGAVV